MTEAWRTWKQPVSKARKKIGKLSKILFQIWIRTAEKACLATKDMAVGQEGGLKEGEVKHERTKSRRSAGMSPVQTEIRRSQREIPTSLLSVHTTKLIQSPMLSIAIRNSIARRVPATATPVLARGLSNGYSEGSVARSQGFK